MLETIRSIKEIENIAWTSVCSTEPSAEMLDRGIVSFEYEA